MYRELLPIWGPISINSFGLCISVGFIFFMQLIFRSSARQALISDQQLNTLLLGGIAATLLGSRTLYLVQNWHSLHSWTDIFAVADGGLSIMGGILSCIIWVWFFSIAHHIPTLPLFDTLALYVPMLQAFGRLGCFCAGCCHGTTCNSWHAVTYTDPKSFAPLHTPLHPTQLYSALSLLVICLILYLIARRKPAPGTLLGVYLLLSGAERFVIDFWRADREFMPHHYLKLFSLHQWLALLFIMVAFMLLMLIPRLRPSRITTHEPI